MPASKRNDLVDAAMQVFYRHGFHGSGVERVLQAGGVSRMTLYNHFKSKDELIVAALRRRDEQFRNRLMRFVEAQTDNPAGRLLAVFDFHRRWFESDDFCGCMFINASAEFDDPAGPIRRTAADHKLAVLGYLRQLCEQAGLGDAPRLAEQLNLLLEGATVTARVVGQVVGNPPAAADRAREAAEALIAAART